MPYRTCPECKGAPQGIEGHQSLILVAYPKPGEDREGVVFRCTVCNTIWRRKYQGSGAFDWRPQVANPEGSSSHK